jgi:TolB-like protein
MKSTLHRACIALAVVVFAIPAMAQTRVAVLPFRNMDGLIERNVWSIKLADSLRLALANIDPSQTAFVFIPADSVEMAISELNLDPTNPQYESDVWKAVAALGAQRVVTGNFFLQGERVLMNAYVYDVATKMPDPAHQAKNLFKTPATYLEAVAIMAKRLHPALMK